MSQILGSRVQVEVSGLKSLSLMQEGKEAMMTVERYT